MILKQKETLNLNNMAHEAQQIFCNKVKDVFPEYFTNVRVCDIGSLDINGNNHYLFDTYTYMGVDVGMGRNVNIISKGHEYLPVDGEKYDVVISTECFEHDMYWDKTIINASENLVRPGGMLLFTCATTGRPEHGTRRSNPQDAPLLGGSEEEWADYYMNLTEEDVRSKIDLDRYFSIYRFYENGGSFDLYFWGIKR
jgi:SAM-dependent methyltransferase